MPSSQTSLRGATDSSNEAILFCINLAKAGILDSRLRGNDGMDE
ncbi:hypothetical protein [Candidatus Tisiphia endosymbiont of Hybos culiciformis]